MLIGAVAFTACDNHIPTPPDDGKKDTTKTETPDVIPDNVDVPENAITVAEANKICAELASGATTTEKYYVKGWVKKLASKHEDGVTNFGNASFYMVNNKNDEEDFYAYQVNGLNGEKVTDLNQVLVGDYVVIYGPLTNYNGTYETAGRGAAYIYSSSNENLKGGNDNPIEIDYQEGEMSVSDFLAVEEVKNLAAGATTENTYTIRGIVKPLPAVSLLNGNATFYITDGTNDLYCYRLKGVDNKDFVSGHQLEEGNLVTVTGKYKHFVSSKGVSTLELIDGNIVRTNNTFDVSTVTEPKAITIEEALAIGNALPSKGVSPDLYIISGTFVNDDKTEISTSYGNLTFNITDEKGNKFLVYRAYYLDNKKYTDKDQAFEDGDEIEITGQIMNYNGTIETQQGDAYVSKHTK